MMTFRCASFFAGVGGIDLGFEMAESAVFKTVYANEFDRYAASTYEENFDIKVDHRDIREVKVDDIPDFDVMLAGFPCQAFSIAGLRQGFNDEKGRGNLFFELERIFLAKQPKVIFLENVKNLVGHDNGNTFKVIINKLEAAGYYPTFKVMNAALYGNIPQNRERIYIVAFKDKSEADRFSMPGEIDLKMRLSDVIDFENKQEDKYYYTKDKCSFYRELKKAVRSSDTVYQWRRRYVRENKSGVCPTLTANMGGGGHNVPIIKSDTGIRKLTPRECFNLQGFPSDYKFPEAMSDTRLYMQAGNSVTVPVIARIAEEIAEAMQALSACREERIDNRE